MTSAVKSSQAPQPAQERSTIAEQIKTLQAAIEAEESLQIKCAYQDELDEARRALTQPAAMADEREFKEWLNSKRDLPVAEVFHDTVARYRTALAQSPARMEPARMTINQSRDYLVKFMERHFTDKTFGRYIRGERGGVNLAGDFAWQLARALRMIEAAQPAVPDGWKPVTRAGQVKVGDKPRIFRRKFTCESL